MHVWIDVGDGAKLSHVRSRAFPDRQLLEPDPETEYQEHVSWQPTEPDMLDDEVIGIDPRQSMRYVRTSVPKQPGFEDWKEEAKEQSGALGWQEVWQKVSLDDMANYQTWQNNVKYAFSSNFEALQYIFTCQSSEPADSSQERLMSLVEFWALCKRTGLTSPTLNLARLNKLFDFKKVDGITSMHDPLRKITFHEFVGALIRISIQRQPKPSSPDPDLPDAFIEVIDNHLKLLTPGLETYDSTLAVPAPFAQVPVRQKLIIHENQLRNLFRKFAVQDEKHELISLDEFQEMFRRSDTMGPDLTEDILRRDFAVTMLGGHARSHEQWLDAGAAACKHLLFSEFVEAVMRAALSKYQDDHDTPVDMKVHELCLLLVYGPASLVEPRYR